MKKLPQNPLARLLLLSVLLIAIGIIGAVIDAERQTRQESCIPFHHWAKATCENASVCTECGETKGIALGHKFGEWNSVKPSCQNSGYEERTCQRCQKVERIEHDALGHDWAEWDIVTPATCTSDGSQVRICKRCAVVETEVIKMLHHHCTATWHDEGYDEESGNGLATIHCTSCGLEMGRWSYSPIYSGLTSRSNEDVQIAGCEVIGTIYNDEEGIYIPILRGANYEARIVGLSSLDADDDSGLFVQWATTLLGSKRNENFPDWYSLKGKTIYVLMVGADSPKEYEVLDAHPAAPRYLSHATEKDCDLLIVFDSPQPGMNFIVFCTPVNK